MSARLRSSTTELEELGEETTLTTSKLRALVQALTGVDIQKDENTFKSIYDILLEIGKEWKNLTDVEQASLSEALFGKRNSQIGFSILNNVDRLEEIYALAQDSAGSAMQEQEKYLAGVQYRIDEFRASVENLANTFMSADFLKNAIKTGTAFVNVLEKIIDNFGTIAALAGTVATALGSKWNIFGKMFEINNVKKSNLPWIQSMTAGDIAGMGNLRSAKMLIDEYNTSFSNLERTTKNTGLTHSQFISEISEGQPILAAELQKLGPDTAYTMRQYVAAYAKATVETIALKAASMALQGALFALLGYIVSVAIKTIDEIIVTSKEAIEIGEKAQQTIEDITSSLKDQQKIVKDSGKQFAELYQGVDKLTGKNLTLSDDDYEEFLNISNQLAELFPTLSYHYDENGNKIVELNGNVDDITESLQKLLETEKELARQDILENMDKVFEGARNKRLEYLDDLASLNNSIQDLRDNAASLTSTLDSSNGLSIPTKYADALVKGLKRAKIEFSDQGVYDGMRLISFDEDTLTEDAKKQIKNIYSNILADAEQTIVDTENKISSTMSSALSQGIASWLYSDVNYAYLSDEFGTYIQKVINGIDWNNLDFESWEDLQAYLSNELLSKIRGNEEEFNILFGLGTQFNNSEITWDEYKKKLEAILPILNLLDKNMKDAFEVFLGVNFEYDEDGNVTGATNSAVDVFKNQLLKSVDGIKPDVAEAIASGLTDAELKAAQSSDLDWNEIIGTAEATEAIGEVRKSLLQVINTPFEIEFNEDAIEEAQGGMKRLQEVYEDLVNANKEGKSGADLASSFTELNKLLEESSKDANDAIKVSDATWQEFFNTMTDGQHTFEEMEAALNKVVTEYVTGTIDIQNFDEAMAKTMSTQLQKFGATKESADAYVATMTDVANTLKQAQDEGHNLISVLDDEAIAWINSADMSDKAREQLALVVLQKQLVNGITINTEGDIKNLQQLMAWAGVTSDSLNKIVQLKKLLNGIISNEQRTSIEKKIDELENQTEEELNVAIAEKMSQYVSLKQDVNKIKDKSGSSGSSKDAWKEAYEKELSELDKLHEMELISDIKYYEKREELNDKYFKGREKYTEEYNKNLSEIYKGFKSAYKTYVDEMSDYWKKSLDRGAIDFKTYCNQMEAMLNSLHDAGKLSDEDYYLGLESYYGNQIEYYNKATNAAQRVIKKRIEALEKEKKALEKNYEAQEKAIQAQIDGINEVIDGKNEQIKAINKQIDAINDEIEVYQKEIDKINEANEERQAALDMQKALYNLNRAEQQRQNLVYNSEKGFIYEADAQAIKDAQDEVNNLEHEQVIRNLEKTISTLQDSIEVLEDDIENIEDEIEVLEEQIDSFEKQIESLEKELDVLVERIEVQINSLEEYSDSIGHCADAWTEAQEDMAAASLWGSEWQNKILSEDTALVQSFEKMYVEAQKNQAQAALDAANEKVRAYNKEIEAINALKEAQQSEGKTGGVSSLDANVKVSKDTTKNNSVAIRTREQQSAIKDEILKSSNKNRTSTSSSSRRISGATYGVGTDNAIKGIHEIAESGDEIVVDNYGNAYLAKGRQLHRFEGGEKVYTPAETNELLNGKYIPIDSLIPNYTVLLTKVMNGSIVPSMNMNSNVLTKRGNTTPMQVDNSIHIEIGDISVTEVDNAAQIAKAIKNQLPNALLQELNRK